MRRERPLALAPAPPRTPARSPSSARPMPSHWEPWPGNTKTTRGRAGPDRPRHEPGLPLTRQRTPAAFSPAAAPWSPPRPGDARGACGERWPCSTRSSRSAALGLVLEQRDPSLGERAERLRRSSRRAAARRRGRRASPVDRAGGRAGASSSTTWALVPVTPNELTPAKAGVNSSGQGSRRSRDDQRQLVPRDARVRLGEVEAGRDASGARGRARP